MSPIRILVADDYEGWRRQLRQLLRSRPECRVVCEVSDGAEAVQKAEELKPDLILLEVGLPKLNGIEVSRRIRQLSPHSKIVFVSLDNSAEVVQVALSTGARGYVYKARARTDLMPAIDAVLRGEQFVTSVLKGFKYIDASGAKTPHRHEVVFYSDDAALLGSFSRFIANALEAGDVAVFIATESRQDSLVRRLKAQGLNIDAAILEGTYIPLDAAKTLFTFMVNDMPDSDQFFEIVGGAIRAAAKAGKREHPRVAACGEIGPFLWAEGKAEAAVRLEQLTEQLAKICEVDILCAYPLSSFHGEKGEQVFKSICAQHSAVYRQ